MFSQIGEVQKCMSKCEIQVGCLDAKVTIQGVAVRDLKVEVEKLRKELALWKAVRRASSWRRRHGASGGACSGGKGTGKSCATSSHNFVVNFAGGAEVAARRVARALGSLKDASGTWKQIGVDAPTGERARLYLTEVRILRMAGRR